MCGGHLPGILTTRGGPSLEPPMVKREGLVRDEVGEGCPGLSNHKMRVFYSQRSKERGQQNCLFDFWRTEFGWFRAWLREFFGRQS